MILSCGRTPDEELARIGRPSPIRCTRLGNVEFICTDGSHLVWTCGTANFHADCIVTGNITLPNEVLK